MPDRDLTLIFALDDDPGRYEHFGRLLEARGCRLVVGCCPACISRWADKASAIMLDHDLGAAACACGAEIVCDDSRPYLKQVADLGVPVIVSSASSRSNVKFLVERLRTAQVQTVSLSATADLDPELKWLGWLWSAGVLCLNP